MQTKLGSHITTQKGYAFKSEWYRDIGAPIVKVSDFTDNAIDASRLTCIPEELASEYQRYCLNTGDVVIQTVGSWPNNPKSVVGKAIKTPHEANGTLLNQNAVRLDPNDGLDKGYLFYLLRNDHFKSYIVGCAQGAASQASITLEAIREYEFELPQLPVQRRIADILSAYDDLIENNTRRIRILEQMAQSVYREWFGKVELQSLPDGWRLAKIGDITDLYRGRSYGSDNLIEEGGLPFLNLKCLARDGGFRPDGLKWYKGIFKENQTAKSGDIIMGLTDMTQERRIVARAARVPNMGIDLFVMSMDLLKISPKPDIHNTYLYALLRFSGFADEVKQHANGVNVLHLSPVQIEQYQFTLPPEALRNKFGEFAEPLYLQCDVLEKKNANLRRTRNLLLPRLVSGEVSVDEMEIAGGIND